MEQIVELEKMIDNSKKFIINLSDPEWIKVQINIQNNNIKRFNELIKEIK